MRLGAFGQNDRRDCRPLSANQGFADDLATVLTDRTVLGDGTETFPQAAFWMFDGCHCIK